MGVSCSLPYLLSTAAALVTAVTALLRQVRHESTHTHGPAGPPPGGE